MTRLSLSCALICLFACSAFAADEDPSGVWDYPPEMPGAREEVYKRIGDVEMKLYVFAPAEQKSGDKRPAIVFFFGGGWRAGTPGQFYPQCKYLASRGMIAVTADYRVASRHQTKPQACVEDAKSAVRYLRENADRLGIDPDRIVAAGGSAGGHVAAAIGTIAGFEADSENPEVSSVPNALAPYNPAVMLAPLEGQDLLGEEKNAGLRERMGGDPAALSPIHHVRKGLPPAIIFHGENDTAVPPATVKLFAKKMQAAGNRCELVMYADQPHGFFNPGRGNEQKRADALKNYYDTTRRLDRFLVTLGYLEGEPQLPAAK